MAGSHESVQKCRRRGDRNGATAALTAATALVMAATMFVAATTKHQNMSDEVLREELCSGRNVFFDAATTKYHNSSEERLLETLSDNLPNLIESFGKSQPRKSESSPNTSSKLSSGADKALAQL